MVSFMHHWALRAFIEATEYLGRHEDVAKYSALAEKVRAACEKELWDGEWYLRGITAKGRKVGSRECEEGKVFLASNTWAVVSERRLRGARQVAINAMDRICFRVMEFIWRGRAFLNPMTISALSATRLSGREGEWHHLQPSQSLGSYRGVQSFRPGGSAP